MRKSTKKLIPILTLCFVLISSLCFAMIYESGVMRDEKGNIYHWASWRKGIFEYRCLRDRYDNRYFWRGRILSNGEFAYGTMRNLNNNTIYYWHRIRKGAREFGSFKDKYGNEWKFSGYWRKERGYRRLW